MLPLLHCPGGYLFSGEMRMVVGVPQRFMGDGINTAWHSSRAVFVSIATATYKRRVCLHDTVAETEARRSG